MLAACQTAVHKCVAEILSLPPHRRPAKEAYCLSPLLDSLFTLEQRSVGLQGTGRCKTGWNWRMQAQPQDIPILMIVFLKIQKLKLKNPKKPVCQPCLFPCISLSPAPRDSEGLRLHGAGHHLSYSYFKIIPLILPSWVTQNHPFHFPAASKVATHRAHVITRPLIVINCCWR